eukprot:6205758-Pleurochrysis_carterae.AAC.1
MALHCDRRKLTPQIANYGCVALCGLMSSSGCPVAEKGAYPLLWPRARVFSYARIATIYATCLGHMQSSLWRRRSTSVAEESS